MSTNLTTRLGEYLVCAELARRGLIATTFTHNIPKFDVLVTDQNCRTVPIQVKTANDGCWRRSADYWIDLKLDETNQTQTLGWEKKLTTPNLIWVCVAVATPDGRDHFYILTERELQKICIANYRQMIDGYAGHRPRNWRSFDGWWNTTDLVTFEDNWALVDTQLDDRPR